MKKGVLILGHGSRRQDANEGLKQLAAMVQANLGMQVVPAYFQFARPSLDEGVASFVNDGVKEIIIVPSLLFPEKQKSETRGRKSVIKGDTTPVPLSS
jgi:precorrin-8X/cobalt-precorrin-8 methylmutase